MDENLEVSRTIDVEFGAEELWELVSDGQAWSEWLVDESDVEVRPGGGGDVVDDGEARRVAVEEVDRARGVRFRWWPLHQPEQVSIVELVVTETGRRSILHVRETRPTAAMRAEARWAVRALTLELRAAVVCHA